MPLAVSLLRVHAPVRASDVVPRVARRATNALLRAKLHSSRVGVGLGNYRVGFQPDGQLTGSLCPSVRCSAGSFPTSNLVLDASSLCRLPYRQPHETAKPRGVAKVLKPVAATCCIDNEPLRLT